MAEERDKEKFSGRISDIIGKFENAREWADLSNNLLKVEKTIESFKDISVPNKKDLAKRLTQCLNPDLSVIHEQTLSIYIQIFKRELDLHDSRNVKDQRDGGKSPAIFGDDFGLFVSTLYNFYQYAAFEVKRKFLKFVKEMLLRFEQELVMSLPGFLLCILPALDDNNVELVNKVYDILLDCERIVGTSKFYGEIWKALLRTPRAKLSAIKYLGKKIPRNIDDAAMLNMKDQMRQGVTPANSWKQNQIYLSTYNLVIRKGKMVVETCKYEEGSVLPDWAQIEVQKVNELRQNTMSLENAKREKRLSPEMVQKRNTVISAFQYFYFPSRPTLVINGLLSGLQSENPLVVRSTFDFMVTHVDIEIDDFVGQEEKVRLVEGALLTLRQRDFASIKKFFLWFAGHFDFDDEEENIEDELDIENDPAVTCCTEAIKRILLRFRNIKPQAGTGSGIKKIESTFVTSLREIHTPMKILNTLFQDQEDFVEPILVNIAEDLIKFIKHFYVDMEPDRVSLQKLKQETEPLLEIISPQFGSLWTALGTLLSKQIDQVSKDSTYHKIEAIDLIIFSLRDMLPIKQRQEERDHKLLGTNFKADISEQLREALSERLGPIISILLKDVEKLTSGMQRLQYAIPVLDLIKQVMPIMRESFENGRGKSKDLELSIAHFNQFFTHMLQYYQIKDTPIKGIQLEAYRRASNILVEIQRYADPNSFLTQPEWLSEIIKSSKQSKNQRIQLISVEILISIIEQQVEPNSQSFLDKNILSLQQLISPPPQTKQDGKKQVNSLQVGVMQTPRHKGFVNLLGKIEQDIKSKNRLSAPKLIPKLNFEKMGVTLGGANKESSHNRNGIKEELSNYSDDDEEENKDSQLSDSFGDELLEIDKDFSLNKKRSSVNDSSQIDEIEQIIRKLWGLLDTTGDHATIVQLLMKFDFLKPKIFGDVIVSDLTNENRDIKRRAVEKFAIFWKLTTPRGHRRGTVVNSATNQLINDFQVYKPFQPDYERKQEIVMMSSTTSGQTRQQANLAIVQEEPLENGGQYQDDDDVKGGKRNYEALHKMLMILEDKDPTLRLSCRSWLQESRQDFSRIIDPLLKEQILGKDSFYRSFSGQLFYTKAYNPVFVIENFNKLRNIILTTQDEFVQYIVTTNVSSYVRSQFDEMYCAMERASLEQEEFILAKNLTDIEARNVQVLPFKCRNKYIQAIVYTTLQYMRTQFVESMGEELYQETQTVNASACEFMELIIRSIQPYKDLATEIIHLIIRPVIQTLRTALDNENSAQQVILLNLLNVILFENEALFFNHSTKVNKRHIFHSARRLFEDPFLVGCLTDGMQHEASFVRYHYIQFTQKIVPYMQRIIESNHMGRHVKELIQCFCFLLNKVDVSAYQTEASGAENNTALFGDTTNHGTSINMQESHQLEELSLNKLHRRQTSQAQASFYATSNIAAAGGGALSVNGGPTNQNGNGINDRQDSNGANSTLIIDQENDIVQILEGFYGVVNHCLGIAYDILEEERSKEEQLKLLGKQNSSREKGWSLFSLFTSVKEELITEPNNEIKQAVFRQAQDILLSCLNCWNDYDVFYTRDLFFTTLGIFPFHQDDEEKMTRNVENQLKRLGNQADFSGLTSLLDGQNQSQNGPNGNILSEYMQSHFNLIQQTLVSCLTPFARNHPEKLVLGILDIWNLDQQAMSTEDFNERCKKVIQLLLALQIPAQFVISAVNIRVKEMRTRKIRKEVVMNRGYAEMGHRQSKYCLFVYTYLVYCHQFIQVETKDETQKASSSNQKGADLGETQEELFKRELNLQTLRFIDHLKYSKHPNTVCWLLEIMHLLTSKFQQRSIKKNQEVKREMREHLSTLLESCAEIIKDEFGLKASMESQFGRLMITPTVYEMLKRFEFNRIKKESTQVKFMGSELIPDEDFILEEMMQNQDFYEQGLGNSDVIPNRQNQNINLGFTRSQLAVNSEIPILKDSIFQEMTLEEQSEDDTSNSQAIFMNQLRMLLHSDDSHKVELQTVLKIFTVVTLRNILIKLTTQIHNGMEEIDKKLQAESIVVNSVMHVIEDQIKRISTDQIYAEFLTELLKSLTDGNSLLQRHYKGQIEALFNHDNFFQMSERSLRKWQVIMRQYLRGNDELWNDLLLRFNQVGGLFTSKAKEIELKSFTFKRLAFLIFSSNFDQITDQLDPLLKKMAEGFKNASKDKGMIKQLFLLSRILMLRLSSRKLAESLQKLWPHLLGELVYVFDTLNQQQELIGMGASGYENQIAEPASPAATSNDNYQLTFEAIKIVELMSQLNIEDFQMNQWMFLFDGFGIEYVTNENESGSKSKGTFSNEILQTIEDEQASSTGFKRKHKEVFQPYLVKFMCKETKEQILVRKQQALIDMPPPSSSTKNANENLHKQDRFNVYRVNNEKVAEVESNFSETVTKEVSMPLFFDRLQRGLKILANEENVMNYAKELQKKLDNSNVKMMKIDASKADTLIERDFLKRE